MWITTSAHLQRRVEAVDGSLLSSGSHAVLQNVSKCQIFNSVAHLLKYIHLLPLLNNNLTHLTACLKPVCVSVCAMPRIRTTVKRPESLRPQVGVCCPLVSFSNSPTHSASTSKHLNKNSVLIKRKSRYFKAFRWPKTRSLDLYLQFFHLPGFHNTTVATGLKPGF